MHLHTLPREGTWIGRTTTTSRTLLLVEVSKATWRITLAALLAWIPDFSTEEFKLEALLRDLPVPDDTRQPAGMTMAEAVEVSDTL